jgi:hypothetical protein
VVIVRSFLICFLICAANLFAQATVAQNQKIVTLTKNLMLHYQSDTLKQKAVTFLLDNIDIHRTENYNWVDNNGQQIAFNELEFENSEKAVAAFKKIKDSIKIRPQTYQLKDIEAVTAEFLIKNIDSAFKAWRNNTWSKAYDFDTFCEFILPYRSLIEPLEEWRENYQFIVSSNAIKAENSALPVEVATNVLQSLNNFRFVESRPDPIPFLSPKQLLFRREGSCNDLANLAVFACRSVGLAVTFDFTPFYGASSNKHFWNTIKSENGEYIPFNGVSSDNAEGLPYNYKPTHKRLAKVYRYSFSKQKNALASIEQKDNIPGGFLRETNIIDVTAEYVSTGKLVYIPIYTTIENAAYLNVFNLNRWRTVDWAKKTNMGYEFNNAGVNIVYLPSIYLPQTMAMKYAIYPILLNEDKQQIELKPNYSKTFSFDITRDIKKKGPTKDFNSFEVFENEIFSLLVWDNDWVKVEDAVSKNSTIHFTKIPDNGLFILKCKKSNGYERIFTINTTARQIEWY